ncbi:MAG: BMP family ABC transporter substrate-binding protein [Spirochaetes bacterium]|nr:BMP family ABC transporter substrate-binding protein [Spirochaetota bacterium]
MALVLAAVLALASGCRRESTTGGNFVGPVKPVHKIGVAFDIGGRGDRAFNDSAYEGIKILAETFYGFIVDDPDGVSKGYRLQLRYLETKADGRDNEQLFRFFAEDGYDLVIGIGNAYTEAALITAKNFPDTHFAVVDGIIPNLNTDSNITCVNFSEHEGAFMVGALAGYLTRSDQSRRVGFLGGTNSPIVNRFRVGFYAGAAFTNPALLPGGFVTKYVAPDVTGFNDPYGAYAASYEMFVRGAAIIFHASGASGAGVFKAAFENDKLAIGVDSDQGAIYHDSGVPELVKYGSIIVTSMIKRVDRAVFLLGKELMDREEVRGGYRLFELADGGVDFAVNQYNEDALKPYFSDLDAIKRKIVDGTILVPENDDQLKDFYAAVGPAK